MTQSILFLCIIVAATGYSQIPKTLNYQSTLAARPSEAESVAHENQPGGRGTVAGPMSDRAVAIWGGTLVPTATGHRWHGRELRGLAFQGRPGPSVSPLFAQAPVYVIDTAVVQGTSDTTRQIYLYSPTGLVTLDLTQQWSNEEWENLWRYTYAYDAGGRMLSDLHELWRNGQWEYNERYSYTYDVNGRVATRLWEDWRSGQQQNVDRITYTYDSDGNLLHALYEVWTDGQWENSARNTYTYDASGNMLTNLSENWTNGQWVNYDRYSYTRDVSGRVLTRLYEQWANSQWMRNQRLTFSYDAGGRPVTETYEEWNYSDWVPTTKWVYTYETDGRMISRRSQVWNVGTGLWLDYTRTTYTYDANGKMLMSLSESWTNVWVNNGRFTYTYDGSGNLTFAQSEEWLHSSWVEADDFLEVRDSLGNERSYFGYAFSMTYKLLVTDVNGERGGSPVSYSLEQNYPNPFNSATMIRYTIGEDKGQSSIARNVRLTVYDVLGRAVAVLVNERRDAGVHQVRFDASGLPSGVYFYRLQAHPAEGGQVGDFTQTKRLMLLK